MRFLGNIEAKIDAKGRVFLPAQFRKALTVTGEEDLVLRRDIFENNLVLYPQPVWDALMDEMRSKLSRWDRREQMVFRTFVSGVTALNIDGSGRILIPKDFLQAACIGRSLRFVGMGDTIEIWADDEENRAPFMEQNEFGAALQSLMNTSAGPAPTQE